jgi:hypothetical protein
MARARADALRHNKSGVLAQLQDTMSSAPDYTATRRGPARLGGVKKTETQAAKTSVPLVTGADIAVHVSDTALNSGKSVDSKDKAESPGTAAPGASEHATSGSQDPAPQDQKSSAASSSGSTSAKPAEDVPAPHKKKAKLHFLKKVIP